ncbi:MAG: riboflavin synthase [Xanthomonadales bacterium]|jgi:riboflavin synthase|nr:riboflavin synthase [Xanthomonadales bacterium]
MFTGIVTHRGRLVAVEPSGVDQRMTFDVETGGSKSAALADAAEGDSMSVSGACLTMLGIDASQGRFSADVSTETLEKTILGGLEPGDPVNLEPALRAADRLGGHLVSGHVDGVGHVVERSPDGRSERWLFEVPESLARYIAVKGSICIDGVSLTVNEVEANRFGVCIIPHTLEVTTLGRLQPGSAVNIEVDMIARYLERLMATAD